MRNAVRGVLLSIPLRTPALRIIVSAISRRVLRPEIGVEEDTAVNRLAVAQAEELRPHGLTALAVTPGFLRSEAMLDGFGVTEANWRDGGKRDPNFLASETPNFIGRVIAALAADPNIHRRTSTVLTSWDLAEEYNIDDIDGRRPHWGRHFTTDIPNPTTDPAHSEPNQEADKPTPSASPGDPAPLWTRA